jgi:hypothetical protein
MWDDHSDANDSWVMAGGDTVLIRGCAPGPNNAAPQCRIGWNTNTGRPYAWCLGGPGPYGCFNPPIPSGTAARHTRILGQNYASCSSGGATNRSALTQIFGGFGVNSVLNLSGTQYVDVECLDITRHSQCIVHGSPAYPSRCSSSLPLDDYDGNGILTTNTTGHIWLQNLWIHGHTNSGIQGPIGGPWSLTRVNVSFNGFAGWNFDDGTPTPDGAGSSITASYVEMIGNGCNEEYPIVHPAFPAVSCYDSNSGGFGDSWSGQQSGMDSFSCDHCTMAYNTKDGFIGPHTQMTRLTITNSMSYGNMGQQWKWVTAPNSTAVFENNLTIGNCLRLSQPMPGAPANYNRFLTLFCRADGDVFSFSGAANSTVQFVNNTVVGYSATMVDLDCQHKNSCSSAHYTFRNNIMLGLLNPKYNPGHSNIPGLYYLSDSSNSVTADHNVYANLRGRNCPTTAFSDLICKDPEFVNEPPLTLRNESQLDNFNFRPRSGSPAIGHGAAIGGIVTDYFGVRRASPPSIGAVEP